MTTEARQCICGHGYHDGRCEEDTGMQNMSICGHEEFEEWFDDEAMYLEAVEALKLAGNWRNESEFYAARARVLRKYEARYGTEDKLDDD